MLESLETGLVYRNPAPHLRAVNAWHPNLIVFPDGEILATFDLGQGPESFDYRRHQAWSTDGGRTWTEPTALLEDPVQPTNHSPRPTLLRDGTLVAIGPRVYRDFPNEGFINRANFGFARMDLILTRSSDRGRTWSEPEVIAPPLEGPAFEACHSPVELADGRLLYPTALWRGWDGHAPDGMKAVALVSHDGGRAWPEYVDLLDDYDNGLVFFEISCVQLDDGRLVVVGWVFHEESGTSRPNLFSIADSSLQFGPPLPTGLNGETAKLLPLGGDRLLCVYRNAAAPGLWGAIAVIREDGWQVEERMPLWQGSASRMFGEAAAATELSGLKLGYPNLNRLPDGDILLAFWCCEEEVYNIRWFRLRAS